VNIIAIISLFTLIMLHYCIVCTFNSTTLSSPMLSLWQPKPTTTVLTIKWAAMVPPMSFGLLQWFSLYTHCTSIC